MPSQRAGPRRRAPHSAGRPRPVRSVRRRSALGSPRRHEEEDPAGDPPAEPDPRGGEVARAVREGRAGARQRAPQEQDVAGGQQGAVRRLGLVPQARQGAQSAGADAQVAQPAGHLQAARGDGEEEPRGPRRGRRPPQEVRVLQVHAVPAAAPGARRRAARRAAARAGPLPGRRRARRPPAARRPPRPPRQAPRAPRVPAARRPRGGRHRRGQALPAVAGAHLQEDGGRREADRQDGDPEGAPRGARALRRGLGGGPRQAGVPGRSRAPRPLRQRPRLRLAPPPAPDPPPRGRHPGRVELSRSE